MVQRPTKKKPMSKGKFQYRRSVSVKLSFCNLNHDFFFDNDDIRLNKMSKMF